MSKVGSLERSSFTGMSICRPYNVIGPSRRLWSYLRSRISRVHKAVVDTCAILSPARAPGGQFTKTALSQDNINLESVTVPLPCQREAKYHLMADVGRIELVPMRQTLHEVHLVAYWKLNRSKTD